MKITIEVSDDVLHAVRDYAIDVGGGSAFRTEPAALRNGLASIAEVALAQRVIDIATNYGLRLLTQCAWCDRISINDKWLRLPCTSYEQRKRFTHGICAACLAKEKERANAEAINEAADAVYGAGASAGTINPEATSYCLPPVKAELHQTALSPEGHAARQTTGAVPVAV